MHRFRYNSIHTRLVITVGMAVVCGVLLASLSSAWRETTRHFESKQNEIAGIAAAIAVPIAPELAAGNRRNIAVALNAIGRIKSIKYARVLSQDGRLVHQLGSGILVTRGGDNETYAPTFGPLDAIYLGAFPFRTEIIHGGQPIGALELIVDLSDLRDALWISIGQALFFGLIAALFGMLASNYFQRRIAEPIVSLTSAMKHVQREHDFDFRAHRMSNDETGELVDAFNAMLGEIRQRDHALSEHRDNLEVTVQERTADLVIAKEEADKANAAKSQFLATMSHEIRTPMNGMLATAELLTSAQLPAKQQRHAEIIMRSGKSLLAIINDILDLSKVEAGKMDLEMLPVEPATLADDVLQLFWDRAQDKGIDLCAYVTPEVPNAIVGDPVRLNQILANLINNALKFTDVGHVLVRMEVLGTTPAKEQEYQLAIHVEDTGIGIAPDKLNNIFDSFVQADSSVSRSYGGTGIGLAICKKLADAMGGELSATSIEGSGSTFTLTLPIAYMPDQKVEHSGAQDDAKSVVLMLEPNTTRNVLQSYLEDVGFSVTCIDDRTDEPTWPSSPYCVFADQDGCQSLNDLAEEQRPEIIVAVDASVARGAAVNHFDAEISCPLSLGELRPLFQAMVDGKPAVQRLSSQTTKRQTAHYARFDGIRVLAADDNAVNREILSEALERLGIVTDCVEDGSCAVDAFKSQTYDIVFMDVSMPVLDGYGATTQIRQHEARNQLPRTPVIALTAHAYGSEANQWQQSGMDACVTKPFTLNSLQQALTELLPNAASKDVSDGAASPDDLQTDSATANTTDAREQVLLDLEVLAGIAEMQREGDNLVERIIDLYRQHAPKALEQLLALKGDAESEVVAAAAHALKSLSRNVGAIAVGDMCDVIETEARAGKAALTSDRRQALGEALEQTVKALARHEFAVEADPGQFEEIA